jgi:hypothetical protein
MSQAHVLHGLIKSSIFETKLTWWTAQIEESIAFGVLVAVWLGHKLEINDRFVGERSRTNGRRESTNVALWCAHAWVRTAGLA